MHSSIIPGLLQGPPGRRSRGRRAERRGAQPTLNPGPGAQLLSLVTRGSRAIARREGSREGLCPSGSSPDRWLSRTRGHGWPATQERTEEGLFESSLRSCRDVGLPSLGFLTSHPILVSGTSRRVADTVQSFSGERRIALSTPRWRSAVATGAWRRWIRRKAWGGSASRSASTGICRGGQALLRLGKNADHRIGGPGGQAEQHQLGRAASLGPNRIGGGNYNSSLAKGNTQKGQSLKPLRAHLGHPHPARS